MAWALSILVLGACGGPAEPPVVPDIETVERTGVVDLPAHAEIQPDELRVVTFAGAAAVGDDGTFSVEATKTTTHQWLFVDSTRTGETVMIGLYDPATETVRASLESTAEALLLLNPGLMQASAAQRRAYLDVAVGLASFERLVAVLQDAFEADPHSVLDANRNPLVFDLVGTVMVEATERWLAVTGAELSVSGALEPSAVSDPPYVEDVAGPGFDIVNPRFITYGGGVYRGAGSPFDPPLQVVTISGRDRVLTLQGVTDPERTPLPLTDGYYRLRIEKGGDIFNWDWNDPVGRATIVNTGHIILSIAELTVGAIDRGSLPAFVTLPNHLAISSVTGTQLALSIRNRDLIGFLSGIVDLVSDQTEALKLWLWQNGDDAGIAFMEKSAGLLKRITVVLQLLDFANGTGPFVFDLAFAPNVGTVYVTLTNGQIVSMQRNQPPTAAFTVSPEAGTIDTTFTFDASTSSDDLDALTELQFRWDFDGDGTYDTTWQVSPRATHGFDRNGSFTVVLQVRDRSQQTSTARTIVNVGGGAGTAKRVVLFRDVLPWDTNATVDVLEALGFTPGTEGDGTYRIATSSEMATLSLVPGRDLVIISNDQPQTFYANYAAADLRIRTFVSNGGALLWGACDRGWARGVMADAGVKLPGGTEIGHNYDYENFVRNAELPIVAGLPATLWHHFASHESFLDLPAGATVYTVDSFGIPTLVEYNFGAGWVMLTGQPLEHQFAYPRGDQDLELLLPRVIAHFTGKPAPAALVSHDSKMEPEHVRPSSGSAD